MQNILVTGADGQLGQELRQLAKKYADYNFIFTNRSKLDIGDGEVVENFFNLNKISFCINCAAYTQVDKAEEEHDEAFLINTQAVENLAKACRYSGAVFIHLSSDFVFDGSSSSPYIETDVPKAISSYGHSKLEGEEKALGANPRTIIIRSSWVYSSFGHNFLKTMLKLGKERDELRVVFDQIGTPTYARDLAKVILKIVDFKELENKYGIYHYSNEGVASWYDFAHAIFEIGRIDCKVTPIETKDFPTAATRPKYSVLNKRKIKNSFFLEIPHWRDSLKECMKQIK